MYTNKIGSWERTTTPVYLSCMALFVFLVYASLRGTETCKLSEEYLRASILGGSLFAILVAWIFQYLLKGRLDPRRNGNVAVMDAGTAWASGMIMGFFLAPFAVLAFANVMNHYVGVSYHQTYSVIGKHIDRQGKSTCYALDLVSLGNAQDSTRACVDSSLQADTSNGDVILITGLRSWYEDAVVSYAKQ